MQSAINNAIKYGVKIDERKRFRQKTHMHNQLPIEPIIITRIPIHVHYISEDISFLEQKEITVFMNSLVSSLFIPQVSIVLFFSSFSFSRIFLTIKDRTTDDEIM